MFITNPWLHRSVRPFEAWCNKSRPKGSSMCMNGLAKCGTSVRRASLGIENLESAKTFSTLHTFSQTQIKLTSFSALASTTLPYTVLFNAHLRRARNVSWCFAFRHKLEENQGKLSKCFFRRLEKWKQEKINCGVFKAAHKLNCWIYCRLRHNILFLCNEIFISVEIPREKEIDT